MSEAEIQDRTRAFIFDELMRRNHAPTVEETSRALGAGIELVRNAYRALADSPHYRLADKWRPSDGEPVRRGPDAICG